MAENDEKKGSMKKTVMLAGAGILAAVAVMWFVVMPMMAPPAEPEDPAAHEPHGVVLELEPLTVNLSGASYLKVGVALHFEESDGGGHGGPSTPSGAKALDVLIDEFSGDDVDKVMYERAAYKESIKKKIAKAYHGEVGAVYFTEYVLQ